MLMHPSESDRYPHVRQGVENALGAEPYSDYFHRTGPLVDIYETVNDIVVSCEVPGLQRKDDINIHVSGRHLTIHGIIQRASEDTQDNRYHRTERFFGHFQRMVDLPEKVLEDSAKAVYRNGILEISMKKAKTSQGKRVDIDFH
jgi:HSP20 family protein